MTGYTVHTGSNEKFSGGWDKIFGKKKSKSKSSTEPPQTKSASTKKSKKK